MTRKEEIKSQIEGAWIVLKAALVGSFLTFTILYLCGCLKWCAK